MEDVKVGDKVLYILTADDSPASCSEGRPAMVVAKEPDGRKLSLQVFSDGPRDGLPNIFARGPVPYDATWTPGTWHPID